jgi:hypothetical protein
MMASMNDVRRHIKLAPLPIPRDKHASSVASC